MNFLVATVSTDGKSTLHSRFRIYIHNSLAGAVPLKRDILVLTLGPTVLWALVFFIARWDLAKSLTVLQKLLFLGPLICLKCVDSIEGIFCSRDK